ncbi:MAG: winged helix DNA-binding domain-containing protein [Anaerolineae bacterium]|nr:MAG: winged helix DNA-binding domain-containing protein [Anaerolineae bacterium]
MTPPRRPSSSRRWITSARGRARVLFGFDYVWEVYKPQPQRKFGYYALPVLWGDRLVARFDSKLDRASNTFVILGLWLEDEALGRDEAFAEAWARAGAFRRLPRRGQAGCRSHQPAAAAAAGGSGSVNACAGGPDCMAASIGLDTGRWGW